MPSLSDLPRLVIQYGYSFTEVTGLADSVYGEIRGGELREIAARFRGSDTICTAAIFVGVVEAIPEQCKPDIFEDMLTLNFDHPLAKISMFRAPQTQIRVLISESSFLWSEPTKAKFDLRMSALYALARAVSLLLASKQALVSTNPFYSEFRPVPSPVTRPQS